MRPILQFLAPASRLAAVRCAMVMIVVLANIVATNANSAEITVEHVKGRTVLSALPRKVVVLDLASLDVLDALGVPVTGVPRGPKPEYLAKYEAASYAKAGTLHEPDYEAVNALAPDLVIVGLRSAPKYDGLSRIAPTIDMTVDALDLVGSGKVRARELARIFGKEEGVEALISRLDRTLASVREKGAASGTGLVIMATGGRISAFGPGSRFGVVHDAFGVRPAAPEIKVGLHGQPISFEFIQKTNPDWLFVLDRDAAINSRGQPAKQLLDNDLVRRTTAWRKGQVIYLDSASFYLVSGGLTSLQRMADQIGAALEVQR